MFKKIDTDITSTFINNNGVVTYTPSFGKELAIKCAILKLYVISRIGTKSIAVKYDNKTIDEINPLRNQSYVYINITDTLSDCLKTGQNSYTLTFVGMPYNSIAFDSARSSVLINYTSQNTKLKNNVYKELDVRRAGKGEVNLSTGNFKLIHSDASLKSGALTLGISHIYNGFFEQFSDFEKTLMNGFGRGWKLNLQQYLIKEKYNEPDDDSSTKIFVYLDGNGDKHIFKEQYFYLDEQKVKRHLMPSQITIDENNELIYKSTINNVEKTYKVEKKVLSSSGFVLTTQLEDFQDIKFVQTNIDEIEEIKQQITSIENTNKQYKKAIEQNEKSKKLLQASKAVESLQYSAQEKSSALEQREINYALTLKDKRNSFEILQNELQILQNEIQNDQLDIQERQLTLQDSQIDIQEKQVLLQGWQNDAQSAQIKLSEKEKEYSKICNELQKLLESKDTTTANDNNIISKREEQDRCFKCLQELKTALIIKQITVEQTASNLNADQEGVIVLQKGLQIDQKALQVKQNTLCTKQERYNIIQKEIIGKLGAFDKMVLKPMLKGASTISARITYNIAKAIIASAKPSIGRNLVTIISMYLGETLTKSLIFGSLAAGTRWLIDKIFGSFEKGG